MLYVYLIRSQRQTNKFGLLLSFVNPDNFTDSFYDLSAFEIEQTKQSLKICCESIGL